METLKWSRRAFIASAAALGAAPAWASADGSDPRVEWTERRDLYPQGVASGDPTPDGVLLWTRHPFPGARRRSLTVQIAEDGAFERVRLTRRVTVSHEADWTCRVLAGGLTADTKYFYRFVDSEGFGSRIGATRTAPADTDGRAIHFAFVSCQNVNHGAQNAFRRMMFEDDARLLQLCSPAEPPRFRHAPRRLHLRDRLVSRGPSSGNVRPAHSGHRPVSDRREN